MARARDTNIPSPSLEFDLHESTAVRAYVAEDDRARKLYAALCNQDWAREGSDTPPWAGSWRYVGGLVADLRRRGEGYLDFYCSGNEGDIDDEVRDLLRSIGWIPVEPVLAGR